MAVVTCAGFAALVLLGVQRAISPLVCTGVVAAAFLCWDRMVLGWRMIPLQPLAFVIGFFLAVETIDRYGLARLLGNLLGSNAGGEGVARSGALGAIVSQYGQQLTRLCGRRGMRDQQ
jgi:arsenical pump membrane protein